MKLEIIGYRCDGSPIYTVIGFERDADDDSDADFDDSDDDDDDSDDEDDDSDDTDDSDDDDDDDDDKDDKSKSKSKPKPGSKTADDKKDKDKPPRRKDGETDVQYALRRERERTRAARRELSRLRQEHESDTERIKREAQEAAEKNLKPVAIRSAASAALAEAGFKGSTKRAVALFDLSRIDIEDGEVYGLEDEVDRIKEDFPELFGKDDDDNDNGAGRQRRRAPRRETGPKGKAPEKKLSSAEKLARQYERSGR